MSELGCRCIQMRSGVTPDANIAAMESLVREAAARGARYVQTPEMTGAVQKSRAGLQRFSRPRPTMPVLARLPPLWPPNWGSSAYRFDGDRCR
jgi:predicted amidohydrolase